MGIVDRLLMPSRTEWCPECECFVFIFHGANKKQIFCLTCWTELNTGG